MGFKSIYISVFILLTAVLFTINCAPSEYTSENKGDFVNESERYLDSIEGNALDIDALTTTWSIFTHTGQDSLLIAHATPYYRYADSTGKSLLKLKSGVYIGQSYLMREQPDSMFYFFNSVEELAYELDDHWALCCINNGLGIYWLYSDINHQKVLSYFTAALRYAESLSDDYNYDIILGNIAVTYYLRSDTTGLKYALQAYQKGVQSGNDYVVYMGATAASYMYYLMGRYDTALKYAEESFQLMDRFHDQISVYTLMANIFAAKGDKARAGHYYAEAGKYSDKADAKALTDLALGYGNFLMHHKMYGEAIDTFVSGIEAAEKANNHVYRYKLYLGLSEAYNRTGRSDKALEYYKIYHGQSDSIFNLERERSFKELLVNYETEKKENEIKEKELQLVRENKKLQVTALLLIMIIMMFAAVYILYKKKNRMYAQLVKRHQEYLEKEKKLLLHREKQTGPLSGQEEMHDKDRELFDRIESLMRDERIYRDKNISIEKLTQVLNTNRSYISKVINNFSGKSFVNYVNSYRINEVVDLLSDPNNDTPLKAISDNLGYNSLTSFYRSFDKAIGVPPSKYREAARKLNKNS